MMIGFIGQGWIGRNYADNFEKRGFNIVRYGLEKEYRNNIKDITKCDVVFIAVPTPTTPTGFDCSILRSVIQLVDKGAIAVIKSTVLPGTTEKLQAENPDIFILHSPEFLTEATAAFDAANPDRNVIGIPLDNDKYRSKAQQVQDLLPTSKFNLICSAREAEIIKYGGNCLFYFKVLFINLLHDLVEKTDCNYEVIKKAMAADPRIGPVHMDPIHKTGRGAGGHCFIKDFAAFRNIYTDLVGDQLGVDILKSLEKKNVDLLLKSNKDLDLLIGVYGIKSID